MVVIVNHFRQSVLRRDSRLDESFFYERQALFIEVSLMLQKEPDILSPSFLNFATAELLT